GAIAAENQMSTTGAIPFSGAVVLAAAEGQVWIGGTDRAMVKLGELKIRVMVGPRPARIDGAPNAAIIAHDQTVAGPRDGMKIDVHCAKNVGPTAAAKAFDADPCGVNRVWIGRVNDQFVVVP